MKYPVYDALSLYSDTFWSAFITIINWKRDGASNLQI